MILVSVAEVAEICGVTKQVISNWRTRKATFPKPHVVLKMGPIWDKAVIVKWRNENL